MKNVKTSVKGKILTIEVDLSKEQGLSGSKKSMIIASSEGNQKVEGTEVTLGINVYKKASKEEEE